MDDTLTTLVIGYNGAIDDFTMSPLRIRPRGGVPRWIYSSLLRYGEDLHLEGDLAESWEVSADGTRYTFRLRPNARWHDGRPVTAADVVFTARLLQQPHRYFRNTLHVAGAPAHFSALDELTVEVSLAHRMTTFPAYLTPVWGTLFLVVPEHVLSDGDEEAFERAPVGSGPFRFGGIDDRGDMLLDANKSYFRGAPRLDRVRLRFFSDNAERVHAFDRGELDVMLFPGRAYSEEDAIRSGGKLYRTTTNTVVQLAMNCRHPLFSSPAVRQAIAAAVDRPALLREVEGDDAVAAFSPVGRDSWAYAADVNRHPYDPERASSALDSQGWHLGVDGLRWKDGEPFRFSVIFPPDTWNYALEQWADGIARYLRNVGIDMLVRPVPYWSGMKPAWRTQTFEAFIYYDTFYVEPDLYWSWHSSMPKRPAGDDAPAGLPQYGYGVTGYSNAKVDQLLLAFRDTDERDEQRTLVQRAQRIMADEAASLWLYNHQWKNVVHDRVRGISEPTLADGTSDLVVLLRPEELYKSETSE